MSILLFIYMYTYTSSYTRTGVIILRKGVEDMVCSGGGDVYILTREQGSPRRCGGQGDILAGILGVSMYWASLGNASSSSILSGVRDRCSSSAGTVLTVNPTSTTDAQINWQEFEQSDALAWRLPKYEEPVSDIAPTAKKQCVSDDDTGPSPPALMFEPYNAAALFSAAVVRRSAALAFKHKGRSVTSPDIIECIGPVFADLVPDDVVSIQRISHF